MKRIIHMSDLHVGHEDLGDRFRTIVQHLIFEKGDKADEYVIVITGDLVNDANDIKQYYEVKTGLDSLRQAGFSYILVVPGNHDYGTGDKGDKKFVKAFKDCFFGKEIEYPKKDIIDGIAFIGLDSMADELHWYDRLWSQGELGKKQLQRLEKMLKTKQVKDCKKRVVYLHHHPFDAWPLHQLKDSEGLGEVVQGKIDAILYGHNHAGKVHNGHWEIPRCYDAGTATLKERNELMQLFPWFKIKSSIRVINLEQDEAQFDYELPLL